MEADGSCNNRTRFADYFVICGLDLTSGLEPDSFAGDNLQSTPLERPYKSKVLGHYPENVSWNAFDKDAVGVLCLPNGLQFRTQKSNLEPKFHTFVITKEDGNRCYGASYIFYEEIKNRKICCAMQTLQAMHLTELSSGRCRRTVEHNTRSLPRHFKLSTHHTRAAISYYDHTKDTLYVSKSIALVLQKPFVHSPNMFLAGLYRCWKDQGTPSLESWVYSLLYEVSIPPPGRSLSFMCYPQERVILQTPTSLEELPFFDFPLRELFTLLGVDCVIQLFTCLLLENQILLCSGEYQKLMLVAESLTSLLLPFSWPHVYVPILPASCHHFLDAPVPFVMGLHTRESRINVPSEANLCYMDLDTRTLQPPEELPSFPLKTNFALEIYEALKRHKVSGEFLDMNLNNSGDSNLMTSSCTSLRRKHSWADELEDDPSLTQGSDILQRIVPLAKRSGFSHDSDLNDDWDSMVDDGFSEETEINSEPQYARDLRINNAIREIFLNRFVQMFANYENFIIQPSQSQAKEEWLNNRDCMQNFDKATFLSDQPQHHLPFLSRFIETQMFATLVDNKILSTLGEPLDPHLRVFESRIKLLRNRYCSPCYEHCSTIFDSQLLLEKRLANIDTEISLPKEILPNHSMICRTQNGFPILDINSLKEPIHRLKKRSTKMSNSYSSLAFENLDKDGSIGMWRSGSEARPLIGSERLSTVPPRSEPSPKLIALTNWEFIEILLKECKQKTKRMLVEKLGSEAVEMGHHAQTIVEENTLIASLCDLLERVWSNGLQRKQGKSALWAHLVNYLEKEDSNDSSSSHIDSNQYLVTPEPVRRGFQEKVLSSFKTSNFMEIASIIAYNLDLSSGSIEPPSPGVTLGSPRSRSESRTSNTRRLSEDYQQEPTFRPLPNTLVYDLRSIQSMTDIKTHVGYARAFVRLSLEKKMLSRHLRTLLSETTLLRAQYKRTAFLRCEEEKEQFLYHLLTLSAVEYCCFTNSYVTTRIPYRVAIYPSRKSSFSSTTANCWIQIYGTLGESQRIPIPKGTLDYVFQHKNVGFLTTLRIGHDNAGLSPKWLVEYIIVRNEITGHTYNFPCGRWLGKGIDDDSTERLLVGEREKEREVDRRRGGSRVRSPSVPPPKKALPLSEIKQMLGECINSLVKHFLRIQGKESTSSLTMLLLCGETGLVYCLEQAFLHGFKSSRLFGRNLYIWDYLVKVKEDLDNQGRPCNLSYYYCKLIEAIMNTGHNIGKDGRFQLFVCLSVRDHALATIVGGLLVDSKVTMEMFEENSFLRDRVLFNFLTNILEALEEYDIVLENSLTYGITVEMDPNHESDTSNLQD